jgi:hypothetical protein
MNIPTASMPKMPNLHGLGQDEGSIFDAGPAVIAPGCTDPCAPCAMGTALYDPFLCGAGSSPGGVDTIPGPAYGQIASGIAAGVGKALTPLFLPAGTVITGPGGMIMHQAPGYPVGTAALNLGTSSMGGMSGLLPIIIIAAIAFALMKR